LICFTDEECGRGREIVFAEWSKIEPITPSVTKRVIGGDNA